MQSPTFDTHLVFRNWFFILEGHKLDGRLLAGLMITLAAAQHYHSLASTKLYCLIIRAFVCVCEQLAHSRYATTRLIACNKEICLNSRSTSKQDWWHCKLPAFELSVTEDDVNRMISEGNGQELCTELQTRRNLLQEVIRGNCDWMNESRKTDLLVFDILDVKEQSVVAKLRVRW